ncbi:peptidase [Litchfieldella qijiaojingensis]|uniref:Peptidase n=1 Tax=Litchfieldella qijiaojingensis TaxID=980347 RepID=A0ABQ2YLY9_9GAMM|nr:Xaa-Pro peptidase family protein [Halomonas qijiaojingensis]GGX87515.1 peptidase [Halomonas qijiaojingensis]
MDHHPLFPREEFQGRLARVRSLMDAHGLQCLLVSKPENIYYLTGLDHQGYFAFHLLVVPLEGRPILITRAMEWATIEDQLTEADFIGHSDSTPPEATVAEVLAELGLGQAQAGVEKHSNSFPLAIYEGLCAILPELKCSDASWLVESLRQVKSVLEIEYARCAAHVTDTMIEAALEVARPGVNEQEIAAEIHRRMILAGGEPPGFTPFIRPTPRIKQEHTSWRNRELRAGEALFLEMAGCVGRYHAPAGRFLYLGDAPTNAERAQRACLDAFDAVVDAIQPGVTAAEVYASWQRSVERSGVRDYRRHHCGYMVGLGYPPSWTGGSQVVGLRHDSDMLLKPGMTFHVLSWLLGSNLGDHFLSNTVVLTDKGCEVLTRSPCQLVAD